MSPKKIYLDTNVFIEAFEQVGSKQSPIWSVLLAVESRELVAVTSEITLAELLPKLISDGETELIVLYQQLFSDGSIFTSIPITRDVLVEASRLRAARMSLRLPDAIHLSTATVLECSVILSNDQRLMASARVPLVSVTSKCLSIIRDIAP